MTALRDLRRAADLSQQEFAALIDVPLNTFRMWDSGLRPTPPHCFTKHWCSASTIDCSRRGVPGDARTERAERRTHPGHRRAQVAQSAVRLSADCARIIAHTFAVDIDQNVVYRVLAKHYRPAPGGTGPSWLSFIGHTRDSLWSVDLFRCESIVLRSYWVLVVMDQFTRRLVGVGVHCGPVNGADVCRLFNVAIHGRRTPRHLSTDRDPLFEAYRWTANLRILEIDEIKTVPHVPLSHPFVERRSARCGENFSIKCCSVRVILNGNLPTSRPTTTRHAATRRWRVTHRCLSPANIRSPVPS